MNNSRQSKSKVNIKYKRTGSRPIMSSPINTDSVPAAKTKLSTRRRRAPHVMSVGSTKRQSRRNVTDDVRTIGRWYYYYERSCHFVRREEGRTAKPEIKMGNITKPIAQQASEVNHHIMHSAHQKAVPLPPRPDCAQTLSRLKACSRRS